MTKVAVGLKEYIILGLGMFLYAFGWTACIIPSGGMGADAADIRRCSPGDKYKAGNLK